MKILKSFLLKESQILLEKTADEVYEKWGYSKIMDRSTFDKIVAGDPTSRGQEIGRHAMNALNLYKRQKYDLDYIPQIYRDLDIFEKKKAIISKEIDKTIRSINDVKSAEQLFDIIEKLSNKMTRGQMDKEKTNIIQNMPEDQVIKIFENDKWLIISPLTHAASVAFGKRICKAKWCTVHEASSNYFHHYLFAGDLFMFIYKDNPSLLDPSLKGGSYYYSPNKKEFNDVENVNHFNKLNVFISNNPELKPIMQKIHAEAEKERKDKNYKLEKAMKRYKASHSPYIPLMYIMNGDEDSALKLLEIYSGKDVIDSPIIIGDNNAPGEHDESKKIYTYMILEVIKNL